MFDKIINYLKGAVSKMFSTNIATKAFNVDSLMSDKMSKAIENWKNIYEGNAPWASKDVEVSETAAQVANEFARLTTLEMVSVVSGSKRADYINEIYIKFLDDLSDKLELGNGVGGIYFKPYVSGNNIYINSIEQGNFIPIAFDGDGNLTSVIFIDNFTSGKTNYTRLEWNCLKNKELVIINKAFKSEDKTVLGKEIDLKSVDKWSDIQPTVVIQNMDKLLGGFYKVPKANNIDKTSPLGVSIFARGIKELKDLDLQLNRLDWEYDSAERKVYVDTLAIKEPNLDGKPKKIKIKERLFKTLNMPGEENFFKDYSPEIRDEAYLRGINAYKRAVEFACDLSYGTISDPAYIEKTAEEIKASKHKSYNVVKKMQQNTEKALNNLIWSIDVLCTLYELAPSGAYEVSYKWDDSLIVDAATERNQDMKDMSAGIMGRVEYRVKWYGESEEEALKNLPQQADVLE